MSRRRRRRRDRPVEPAYPSLSSRPDEGADRGDSALGPEGARLWRPDEGQPVAVSGTDGELWRTDEGVVVDDPPDPGSAWPAEVWRRDESREGPPAPREPDAATHIWDSPTPLGPSMGDRPPTTAEHGQEVGLWRENEATSNRTMTPSSEERAGPPPPPPAPSRTVIAERTRSRSTGTLKRVVNIVSLVLSVALFLFAGDLAYALIGIRNSLQSARSDLERAESAFSDGDLPAARRFFEQAEESSKSAAGYAKQPALALTANFSPFEPDTRVIRTLPDAARLSAKAGLEAVKGGAALGIEDTDGIAASLYSGGQIRLDALAKARPFVERATAYLDDADLMLASAPVASVSYLQDALDEASNRIGQALTTASKGNALLTSLPSLLGEDAPRRYLLAFQALGEARATGGLIGLYGVLSADNGKLSLGHIGPITEVFPGKIDAVEAPAWFENAYGPQTALRQVQQVNVSPNFPVVSEVLLRMFEQETGKNLDGVLSMDPVALGYLLEGTGPIEVPGSPPVTADNAAESVLHDSYVRFDRARDQNEYLGQLVSGFWKAVKAGEVNGPALAQGLAKAVSTQHVKVYSSSDDDQRSLGELGADGNYEAAGENVQMVFHNNYGLNKIDYYLRRTIDTTVAIDAGGNAHVTTNATLVNTAPSGPPSLLIGKAGEAFNPGTNRMFLNFLLPEGADVQSLDVNGETSEPPVYRDDGNTVPWGILNIDAGETVETSVSYVLPGVARAGRFEMTLFPQAAAHPDEYNLIVTAPDGFALRPASGGVSPTKTFTANGTLDQPAKVELEVTDAS